MFDKMNYIVIIEINKIFINMILTKIIAHQQKSKQKVRLSGQPYRQKRSHPANL